MTMIFNQPNYSFLIEAIAPDGEPFMIWRIDQVLGGRMCEANYRKVSNTVERYLHSLSAHTGLRYNIWAQGPKEDVDRMVKEEGIEVS